MTERKASDLIIERFSVPASGVYVERNGVRTRGQRPEWIDWPMHTAADIGPKWIVPVVKR
jgi:hypothetical protein